MVWEVQCDCLQPGELAEVHGRELRGDLQRGRAISSSFAGRCRAVWAEIGLHSPRPTPASALAPFFSE